MKNQATASFNNYIKVFCVLIATLTILSFAIISMTMDSIPPIDSNTIAQNGKLETKNTNLVYLQGDWSYYKDVFLTPENFDDTLLIGDEFTTLPYLKVTKAKGTATYKLDLKFDDKENLLLYIPYLNNDINVFLNGELLVPLSILDPAIGTGSAMFKISHYNKDLEYQQLVISANQDPKETTFYKRYIILAPLEDINTLIFSTSINQFIFFIILLVITFNGFIFMFLHPSHKIMTTLALFDFSLLTLIGLNLPVVLDFYTSLDPFFALQDSTFVRLQMAFIMLTGALGISLSKAIFDPNFEVNKRLWHDACIALFIFFGVLFLWDVRICDKYGTALLVFAFTITFIGVFKRFLVYYKNHGLTGYFIFQSLKTVFIGVVIFWDVVVQHSAIYNNLAIYNYYLVFLALHLVTRLHDNYANYKEVRRLNVGLEVIVAERTRNLSDANEALQKSNIALNELSIKDALTKIFNRLHFERKVEELLSRFGKDISSLYLCIFDLDFFKKVNDTYGHDQGNNTLIEVAAIASSILPEDCVFARIGGEEFAIIFANMDDDTMLSLAERIRAAFELNTKAKKYATTGSFGISKYSAYMNAKEWFVRADKALYKAKASGRNKIMHNLNESNL